MEEQKEQQLRNNKTKLIILGIVLTIVAVVGITYAFFNYTRIGANNSIKVGRIYFNSGYEAFNLTNAFPITSTEASEANNPNVKSLTINVVGDTDYSEGIEYLVTASDVHMTVGTGQNAKQIPLALEVGVENNTEVNPEGTLGTIESGDYYTLRTGYKTNGTSKYKVVYNNDILHEGDRLLVGYIAPNSTPGTASGINGLITIKAYFDKTKIAITDTYPQGTVYTVKSELGESDITACQSALTGVSNVSNICDTSAHLQAAIDDGNVLDAAQITALENAGIVSEYTDGTLSTWVGTREVFTTEEWNSIQGTPLSFKVKVEANEGIWVPNPGSAPMVIDNTEASESIVPGSIRNVEITPNGNGTLSCSSSNESVATCSIEDEPTVEPIASEIEGINPEIQTEDINEETIKVKRLDTAVGTKYLRITAVGVGTARITVTQSSGSQYATPSVLTYDVEVAKLTSTMSLSSNSGTITQGESATATITTNGDGTVSCQSNSANATCTVDGSTLTINGVSAGSATITVSQTEGTTHLAPSPVTYTATINPSTVTITYNANGGSISPSSKDILITSTTYGVLGEPTPASGNLFVGWYTDPTGGTQVLSTTSFTNGTSPTTLYAHYASASGITCKRVFDSGNLHTEQCITSDTAYYCQADGYVLNADITYGNAVSLGTNTLTEGDAFDCKVSTTGGYTERFYYVSPYYNTDTKTFDDSTGYVTLIYYSLVNNGNVGKTNSYYHQNDNWHGPEYAKSQLPTTSKWSNIRLKTDSRTILAMNSYFNVLVETTLNGNNTIVNPFSYSGKAARLLTAMELKQSRCATLSGKSGLNRAGSLKACNFLLEGTKYAGSTYVYGSWLETPHSSSSGSDGSKLVWYMDSLNREVSDGVVNSGKVFVGVRPAIDVPMSAILK